MIRLQFLSSVCLFEKKKSNKVNASVSKKIVMKMFADRKQILRLLRIAVSLRYRTQDDQVLMSLSYHTSNRASNCVAS